MTSRLVRIITFVALGPMAGQPLAVDAQADRASWLDESEPAAWSGPAPSLPAAPAVEADLDPRCLAQARPAEREEDRQLEEQGWHLDGAYQGGWDIVVVRGTARYDGMCRPWRFQSFVFVGGTFAGTLAPEPMDSRTDGALTQVLLQDPERLTAEYVRYAADDPLCCPSAVSHVVFDIARDEPGLRPVSTSTSSGR